MNEDLISASVTVVGTLNIDRVWTVPALPRRGQTILAATTRREFGGKGANQAVAAARFGAHVTLLGRIGPEDEGAEYREYLRSEGIDVSLLDVYPEATTGTAHVYVDPAGENQIVVDIGASAGLCADHLDAILPDVLKRSHAVLTQLETPLSAVLATLRHAAARGCRSVLNASPCVSDFPWGTVPIDTVIVNEHECVGIFGHTPERLLAMPPSERGRLLAKFGVEHLVVTRGRESTLHFSPRGLDEVPTMPVQPLDTVGAGDTFAGVLAVALCDPAVSWVQALWQANVAAAVSTTASGAQSAMPTRRQVETHLRELPALFSRSDP